MSRAARFAAVLATMHAAHNIGDHVVQTDRQARRKIRPDGWGALAGHVASYHATQAAALVVADRTLGLRLNPVRLAAALVVSAGTHALLDRRWPVRWVLERTGSKEFAQGTFLVPQPTPHDCHAEHAVIRPVPLHGPYLADQALHHGCLWLAALVAAGGR